MDGGENNQHVQIKQKISKKSKNKADAHIAQSQKRVDKKGCDIHCASSPLLPLSSPAISDDCYLLYQRIDMYGRMIHNDTILVPCFEVDRYRINIPRFKRANADNNIYEKSLRIGPKAAENLDNCNDAEGEKSASSTVKTDAKKRAVDTTPKRKWRANRKARKGAEGEKSDEEDTIASDSDASGTLKLQKRTHTGVNKDTDAVVKRAGRKPMKITKTQAQVIPTGKTAASANRVEDRKDEGVEMTFEEVLEAIDGVNINDGNDGNANPCHSDRADTMESNCKGSTAVSETDCEGSTCVSDSTSSQCEGSTAASILNNSRLFNFWNDFSDAEGDERVDPTIDVDNHSDVRRVSDDNGAHHSMGSNFDYGTTVLHFHISIPAVNVKHHTTSTRIKCRDVSRSRLHAKGSINDMMSQRTNCNN